RNTCVHENVAPCSNPSRLRGRSPEGAVGIEPGVERSGTPRIPFPQIQARTRRRVDRATQGTSSSPAAASDSASPSHRDGLQLQQFALVLRAFLNRDAATQSARVPCSNPPRV